jgi:hypothetical protein
MFEAKVSCGRLIEVVKKDGTLKTVPCTGFIYHWGGHRFDRRTPCTHPERKVSERKIDE